MLPGRHDALARLDEFIVSDNAMIRSSLDTKSSQSGHDDHSRYALPRGIVKMQVFHNEVIAAKDECVPTGIAGCGIGKLGQGALSVGSQPYRLGCRAGFTNPNTAGKGRPPLEMNDVSRFSDADSAFLCDFQGVRIDRPSLLSEPSTEST